MSCDRLIHGTIVRPGITSDHHPSCPFQLPVRVVRVMARAAGGVTRFNGIFRRLAVRRS